MLLRWRRSIIVRTQGRPCTGTIFNKGWVRNCRSRTGYFCNLLLPFGKAGQILFHRWTGMSRYICLESLHCLPIWQSQSHAIDCFRFLWKGRQSLKDRQKRKERVSLWTGIIILMIKREFKPTLSHRFGIIMASFCSPLVTRHPSPPPRMTGQLSRLPHTWWPQHFAINQHIAMHNAAAINFAINWQIYIAKHHEDTLLHWLCLYNRMETHLHVYIV